MTRYLQNNYNNYKASKPMMTDEIIGDSKRVQVRA